VSFSSGFSGLNSGFLGMTGQVAVIDRKTAVTIEDAKILVCDVVL
jgi:hypothetical protein